jgi:hypothetical protein
MKTYRIIILFFISIIISCNEDKFLEEEPLDFYAPENAYITAKDFETANTTLYSKLRGFVYINGRTINDMWIYRGTDACYHYNRLGAWEKYTDNVNATTAIPAQTWTRLYRIVYDANVVIGRIDGENTVFTSENTRKALKAEALFFRAFAYRTLAALYGGVPLVVEEIKSPRRDFVRATREEIYQQCVEDLKYAAENLPDIDQVKDGKVSKPVASHLLSEVYISLSQWDNAIASATNVIGNPELSLMTTRFGSRKNEAGDVYWDLFQRGNQNRGSGNTESLLVIQWEYLTEGGGTGHELERNMVPYYWMLKDRNNVNLFIGPTTQNYGRGIGYIRPTYWAANGVWGEDFYKDMRNSQYNIVRDLKADNPASAYNGKWLVADNAYLFRVEMDTLSYWYPIYAKCSTPNDHPAEFIQDPKTGLLKGTAGESFRDQYLFRLAETYLLRAEAYLGKNDKINAAKDINVVRSRANATPVEAAEINIDYILDERLRELMYEEWRRVTLARINKLVDRTKRYNPMVAPEGYIKDFHNLFPIPYSEIERNTEAVLEQNPGY